MTFHEQEQFMKGSVCFRWRGALLVSSADPATANTVSGYPELLASISTGAWGKSGNPNAMSEHRTQATCLLTTKLMTSSKLHNFCDVWRPKGRVQECKYNPLLPHTIYVRGKWGILRYCKTRERKVMRPSKALTNDMSWCGEQRFAIIRKSMVPSVSKEECHCAVQRWNSVCLDTRRGTWQVYH
jgi:hypothetical protein